MVRGDRGRLCADGRLGLVGAFGWRHEFAERSWDETREFLRMVSWRAGEADHLFEIIDSVLESGADRLLVVTTSMHDLLVAPRPVSSPPIDVVAVRAPSSPRTPADGHVLIEYLGRHCSGTAIERPVSDAGPLFWRFMHIEFGVTRVSSRHRNQSHHRPDLARPISTDAEHFVAGALGR